MNKKKKVIVVLSVVIASMLLITAGLAFYYVHSRQTVSSGDLLIKSAQGDTTVTFNDLNLTHVEGEIKNKKGEVKQIDSEGIALSDIPALAGANDYSAITVFADDEYNAELTKNELAGQSGAWLIKNDSTIRLVVFGDSDSKRDVKNVVRIEIK